MSAKKCMPSVKQCSAALIIMVEADCWPDTGLRSLKKRTVEQRKRAQVGSPHLCLQRKGRGDRQKGQEVRLFLL